MDRAPITSLSNPKIKEVVKLRDRRHRDESSLFLIEGYRELKRAFEQGVAVQRLFFAPELFLGVNERALIEEIRAGGGEAIECRENVFAKISYRDRPDGLLGVGVQVHLTLGNLEAILFKEKSDPFLFIAESIEKPGNLGAMLRSADGAGVDGVIVCDPGTDIYNPNVVRSSVGTLFSLPIVQTDSTETLFWLKKHGIRVIATSPHAKIEYTEADLRGPIAVIVGTEQLGLSDVWTRSSDLSVSIPMRGMADSLNVANAATLLLYEVLRQRKAHSIR